MSEAIDGTDGASWHLPLPPLDSSSLEPYSPGNPPCMALQPPVGFHPIHITPSRLDSAKLEHCLHSLLGAAGVVTLRICFTACYGVCVTRLGAARESKTRRLRAYIWHPQVQETSKPCKLGSLRGLKTLVSKVSRTSSQQRLCPTFTISDRYHWRDKVMFGFDVGVSVSCLWLAVKVRSLSWTSFGQCTDWWRTMRLWPSLQLGPVVSQAAPLSTPPSLTPMQSQAWSTLKPWMQVGHDHLLESPELCDSCSWQDLDARQA